MRATDWEVRHSMLLHQIIVVAAFLVYLVERDDMVWRIIKGHGSDRQLLERSLFAIATLLVGIGAAICTWGNRPQAVAAHRNIGLTGARRSTRYLGDLLYAVGLGSLAPLWGFAILVGGEAIRLNRLIRRSDEFKPAALPGSDARQISHSWWEAFRQQTFKWGMFVTMIVFTITLKDRVAEVLIGIVCVIGLLLTSSLFRRSAERAID